MFTRGLKYAVCGIALCSAASFSAASLAASDDCTFIISGIPAGVKVYNDNDPSVVRNFSFDASHRCISFTSSVHGLIHYLRLNNMLGFQALGTYTNRSRGVVMFCPKYKVSHFAWGPVGGDSFKYYDVVKSKWGKKMHLKVHEKRAF